MVAVGMAGVRDDETGAIALNNGDWPAFNPIEASKTYGIQFSTANDMIATAAGAICEAGVDLKTLKPGTPTPTGTKLVIAISTGIGVAAAVWDRTAKRHVLLASEGGHIGFQPKDEEELRYLSHLHRKYPHASAELALAGKHGINNLIDHSLRDGQDTRLAGALKRARASDQPPGGVQLEGQDDERGAFGVDGDGADFAAF
jgi:glucokinase